MSMKDGALALPVPALYQWLEPALGPIAAAAVPVPTGPRSWWGGRLDVEGLALIESRRLVDFVLLLVVYRAAEMAAMVSVWLVGWRRAIEVSER